MTVISIHQPGFLPWLGFFKKIMDSDIFVFLDDAQYKRKFWHNRNMIRTSNNSTWLSVPVKSNFGMKINEVPIDSSTDWRNLHKKSIQINYAKSEYFQKYWKFIEQIYNERYDLLIDLNMRFIRFLMKEFDMNTKTIFSSELGINDHGSNLILEICKKLDADTYVSGMLGVDYLQVEDFVKNNIQVKFQNFQHPIYKQCFEPFVPNMAALDLLLNEGQNSSEILRNSKD